ncbi:MAG: hypothetical protein CVU61_10200 [Deltaproteobacteria bacterium HGW-Deltaproteobacteria-19]|jgi:hypothetical protein|nr:MAG: hypothetical protein CVU61_10200 [Deltaproteobacteria bacterium HGW-Deltaproteobacteria-19]
MNGKQWAGTVILCALFLAGTVMEAEAFRCRNGGLVSEGDRKAKVLLECGEPMLKEKVAQVETGSTVEEQTKDRKKGTRKKVVRKKKQTVERWSYNCGENDFIYQLSFQGGVLKQVETAGRGKGPARCQ